MFESRIKVAARNVAIFAAFLAAAFIAPHEAHAKDSEALRPIGKSQDGKYRVYNLEGGLSDVNWFATTTTVYNSKFLAERIGYIQKNDVNNGQYVCEYVCKDKLGRIVGVNPAYQH